MDAQQIARDLDFAIAAARSAGERLVGLRDAGRWQGRTLGDVGDQAADGFLRGLLEGRYPDDGVLSEETTDDPERLAKERAWIVDPLDGTKEFSEGREDWGVHVALTVGGRCAVGAVALPSLGRTLFGVALEGHERGGCVDADGSESELARGDVEPKESAAGPRVVVSRSHTPPWVERFGELVGASVLDGWGSAGYKAARLLLGHADVYVHAVGLKEWDTCAPETVARALGWSVCKLRGEQHSYNQRDPRNHELVVCRTALRERVLDALAASGALETR